MVWSTTQNEFGEHVENMVAFARKWALTITLIYHEGDDSWSFETDSAAPAERLLTKDRSSICVAWTDLMEQWEKILK